MSDKAAKRLTIVLLVLVVLVLLAVISKAGGPPPCCFRSELYEKAIVRAVSQIGPREAVEARRTLEAALAGAGKNCHWQGTEGQYNEIWYSCD